MEKSEVSIKYFSTKVFTIFSSVEVDCEGIKNYFSIPRNYVTGTIIIYGPDEDVVFFFIHNGLWTKTWPYTAQINLSLVHWLDFLVMI